MNYNRTVIVGRVGKDPEIKSLPNGAVVASFSVATSRSWKDPSSGEKKEEVEWHNVVFWNKPAEIIGQYVKKGSLLLVEGRLQTRTWEKDGVNHYRTEIIGENFQLPPKSMSGGEKGDAPMWSPKDKKEKSAADKKFDEIAGGSDVDTVEYPDEEVNLEDIPF